MLSLIFSTLLLRRIPQSSLVAQLNQLAVERNVQKLNSYLDAKSREVGAFNVIATNGVYGCGSKGWKVSSLRDPITNRRYFVFWTPITSEDIGDLLFKETKSGLSYIPEDKRFGARILRHAFTIKVEPNRKSVVIVDACSISKGDSGKTFLRLNPEFVVQSILESGRKLAYSQADGVILVHLPRGISNLQISYSGVVNEPYYAGSISSNKALLMDEYWYPMIARWPAPYSERIYAPKAWTVIGQGELQGHKVEGNEGIWQYQMNMPVSIYSLDMGLFHSGTFRENGRVFSAFSASQLPEDLKFIAETYAPVVDFYSKIYKKFPFSHYFAVGAKEVGDDALEAYSFASYGHLYGEDSHEPSHTWWGGFIPNTYLHSLWNESFADFSMELYAQGVPIGNANDRRRAFFTHPFVGADDGKTSIENAGAFSGGIASYMGYGKGSYVLMQLDSELGNPLMLKCMKDWLNHHDPNRPGEWSGFENAVYRTAGRKYKWFFDQWLRRPGYPHLRLAVIHRGVNEVEFSGHFIGDPYKLKLPYIILVSHNLEQFHSIEIPSKSDFTFKVRIPDSTQLISFDPYLTMIRKINPNEYSMTIEKFFPSSKKFQFGTVKPSFNIQRSTVITSMKPEMPGSTVFVGLDQVKDPIIQRILANAGIKIEGKIAKYHGEKVNLTKGGIAILLNLPNDQHEAIVIGTSHFTPVLGDSQVAMYDFLGRFLAGSSSPKESGNWVFRL